MTATECEMSYTKVKNVMSSPAITAHQSTPYRGLVELLAEHRIGFLPVVDDAGKVVGVVSESDLLCKEANPHASSRSPLLERRRSRLQREKAVGTTAAEVMTAPPETVESWASVTRAAQLMQEHRVKHLAVVDTHGQLTGVVSRGDLLRVFLRADNEIQREIIQDVLGRELMLNPWDYQVEVHGGEVTLSGHVERRSMAITLVSAVEAVEGVTRLNAKVTWRTDDLEHRDRAPYSLHGSS